MVAMETRASLWCFQKRDFKIREMLKTDSWSRSDNPRITEDPAQIITEKSSDKFEKLRKIKEGKSEDFFTEFQVTYNLRVKRIQFKVKLDECKTN